MLIMYDSDKKCDIEIHSYLLKNEINKSYLNKIFSLKKNLV